MSVRRSFKKESLKILSSTNGWFLDAWSYIPDTPAPHPVIIMAHGIGCNKRMGLDAYAAEFATAGYAAIVFDYRRWGDSDGTPRNLVFVAEMQDDYRSVVSYAQSQPQFDASHIILWGFSFGGGHAMTLSTEAQKLGVCAAISKHPFVGVDPPTPKTISRRLFRLLFNGIYDKVSQAVGFGPVYMQTTSKPDGPLSLLSQENALEGFHSVTSKPDDFPNIMGAGAFLEAGAWSARNDAPKINIPILILKGADDRICLPELITKAYEAVPAGFATLVEVPGDHFDAFANKVGWVQSLKAQLQFLSKVAPV